MLNEVCSSLSCSAANCVVGCLPRQFDPFWLPTTLLLPTRLQRKDDNVVLYNGEATNCLEIVSIPQGVCDSWLRSLANKARVSHLALFVSLSLFSKCKRLATQKTSVLLTPLFRFILPVQLTKPKVREVFAQFGELAEDGVAVGLNMTHKHRFARITYTTTSAAGQAYLKLKGLCSVTCRHCISLFSLVGCHWDAVEVVH